MGLPLGERSGICMLLVGELEWYDASVELLLFATELGGLLMTSVGVVDIGEDPSTIDE